MRSRENTTDSEMGTRVAPESPCDAVRRTTCVTKTGTYFSQGIPMSYSPWEVSPAERALRDLRRLEALHREINRLILEVVHFIPSHLLKHKDDE